MILKVYKTSDNGEIYIHMPISLYLRYEFKVSTSLNVSNFTQSIKIMLQEKNVRDSVFATTCSQTSYPLELITCVIQTDFVYFLNETSLIKGAQNYFIFLYGASSSIANVTDFKYYQADPANRTVTCTLRFMYVTYGTYNFKVRAVNLSDLNVYREVFNMTFTLLNGKTNTLKTNTLSQNLDS